MKRTIVVTGANSGIGKAMALQLATAGHHVALVCRNPDKGATALREIQTAGDARLFLGDLSKRADIDRVSTELVDAYGTIDSLCNNAGVHLNKRYETDGGLEMMYMVNHLAPFLLTEKLLGALEKSADPRVVTTSSLGHRGARVRWDDMQCARSFNATIQYCNTKLYNIWFTTELQRRHPKLTTSCFHPGAVATGFAQDDPGILNTLMKIGKPFLRSSTKAARTGSFLAASDDASDANGRYYADSKPRKPSKLARDRDAAKRLWELSESQR